MTVYLRTNYELARLIIIPVITALPGRCELIHPELKKFVLGFSSLGVHFGFFWYHIPKGPVKCAGPFLSLSKSQPLSGPTHPINTKRTPLGAIT